MPCARLCCWIASSPWVRINCCEFHRISIWSALRENWRACCMWISLFQSILIVKYLCSEIENVKKNYYPYTCTVFTQLYKLPSQQLNCILNPTFTSISLTPSTGFKGFPTAMFVVFSFFFCWSLDCRFLAGISLKHLLKTCFKNALKLLKLIFQIRICSNLSFLGENTIYTHKLLCKIQIIGYFCDIKHVFS